MGSSGKKKTTMAKLMRETKLRERRLDKQARKDARKAAAADGYTPLAEPADVDGAPIEVDGRRRLTGRPGCRGAARRGAARSDFPAPTDPSSARAPTLCAMSDALASAVRIAGEARPPAVDRV